MRDSDGQFIVKLPWNSKIKELGESKDAAVRRWKQVERRLVHQEENEREYHKFMTEYQALGHMEQISEKELSSNRSVKNYYLPHHFILKSTADTTKFRVVFDGSAQSTSRISINDCMTVGPTIQDDLFSLLLRFRLHPIALKADIKKMYRQFKVDKSDADFQRIVYRPSTDQPIRDYRLLTVTYGTASAPFLATRCLKQLSIDERKHFPEAAAVLEKDLYVDDLMSGAGDVQQAINLQQQLCSITEKAKLLFCKWSTNSPEVRDSIPIELRETTGPLKLDTDESIKALGVQWNPGTDTFSFSVTIPTLPTKLTKRVMLSELAKVFDPLGWLSPVTIRAKMMFQSLWRMENLKWDDTLPPIISQQWIKYQNELKAIEDIHIPRCLISSNGPVVSKQLHGFSDASEKAYAACIYLKCVFADGVSTVKLITAKTKVAPEKTVSLPRLELCGAVMMSNLLTAVEEQYKTNVNPVAWTDSEVVLRWLESSPSRWKTFVANRISEIQDLIPASSWHHVSSELNPSDCASRGISAQELKSFDLYWNGPEFLKEDKYPIFSQPCSKTSVEAEERKRVLTIYHVSLSDDLINKYSSLTLLQRVTAYCLRFVKNLKHEDERQYGPLTPSELQRALYHWIIQVQYSTFKDEIKVLKSSDVNKQLSNSSVMKSLNPFVDEFGLIRVGGRLQNANVPEDQKHPIILPNKSQITTLIIESYHITHLHAGIQLMQAALRNKFWIISSKEAIKKVTRKCVVCRRHRAATTIQLMGNLPSARVKPSRPFSNCGVDYAGPFNICAVKGRGQKTFKHYIALFVCLSSKAIHLESVSDLTTEAFIAAYKRFTSRRGISSDMFSDCGTNFVGADRELQSLLKSAEFQSDISHKLADHGTRWHFNPPAAPHQGGLWEAGVKSVKYHLRRVVGAMRLTVEDFQTILCQIEACLNSRPLCAMSTDPSDLNVLTPGHFLIGQPLNAIPEPDLTHLKINTLSRWQFTQQLFQHFWHRWCNEYLTTLQQRFKWTMKRANYQVDDLVIIKDELQPPMKWKMGRIISVNYGDDKCVRSVTLKTEAGVLDRPIVKLCPLISNDELCNN